jgi:hypothetical protein
MFGLEREMLHIEGAEEIKTDISSATPFFRKSYRL